MDEVQEVVFSLASKPKLMKQLVRIIDNNGNVYSSQIPNFTMKVVYQ